MIRNLNETEVKCVSGGTNQEVYAQVDAWIQNNPNQFGQHWEAFYTFDNNWNITYVEIFAVSDYVTA